MNSDAEAAARHSIDVVRRVGAYARLAKVTAYHHLYAWTFALLLLQLDGLLDLRAAIAMFCVLVTMACIKSATCAIDDVVGFRDGSDARNYASGGHMPPGHKPLLTGALTESDAIRFAVASIVCAVLAGGGVLLSMDCKIPVGVYLCYVLVFSLAIQYSWGARFSYRPAGMELVVFVSTSMEVISPYWLVAGSPSFEALSLGALVGLSTVLIVVYANIADRYGDRLAARRTLAAVLRPGSYCVYVVAVTLCSLVAMVIPFLSSKIPNEYVILVVPAILFRCMQFYCGILRNKPDSAVRVAFRAIDVGGLGIAAALVLT